MPDETPEHINAFTATVESIEDGGLLSDLDKQLRQVVQEARRTGKKATLVFKLELQPRGADTMFVTYAVDQKMPKVELQPAVFFDNEGGDLQREHPKQTTLTFTEKKAAS